MASRQFECVLLTRQEIVILRDAIKPLANVQHAMSQTTLATFCRRVYDAYITLETRELEEINLPLSEDECMIINHFIGSEDFEGALGILRQTWAVLYEIKTGAPPPYLNTNDIIKIAEQQVSLEASG